MIKSLKYSLLPLLFHIRLESATITNSEVAQCENNGKTDDDDDYGDIIKEGK